MARFGRGDEVGLTDHSRAPGERAARPDRWLALVPPLGLLVGVPFANHVHRYVLGLPFLLFWIVACVVLTSIVMALIHTLDRRHDAGVPTPERTEDSKARSR